MKHWLCGSASFGVLAAASHWATLSQAEQNRVKIAVAPESARRGDTMTLPSGQVIQAGVPYRREEIG